MKDTRQCELRSHLSRVVVWTGRKIDNVGFSAVVPKVKNELSINLPIKKKKENFKNAGHCFQEPKVTCAKLLLFIYHWPTVHNSEILRPKNGFLGSFTNDFKHELIMNCCRLCRWISWLIVPARTLSRVDDAVIAVKRHRAVISWCYPHYLVHVTFIFRLFSILFH